MRKYLFLAVIFSACGHLSYSQITETRTSNSWDNYSNNLYVQWGTQYVSADDNSYAYTKKINKLQRVYLVLRNFGFTIPADAVIDNIIVKVRKFKSGQGNVKDCFVHLLTTNSVGDFGHYGAEMANTIDLWPSLEAEANYSQPGSGNNGIADLETHTTQPYQWTPALINNSAFGIYLVTDFPDKGFYYVYFDKVEITVAYSQPATISGKSPASSEANTLKEPIVYPNPFTLKTNIQFTAAESGNAIVELYNITGAKIRTLYSGAVAQGQVYNIEVGDARLPKGIYVYMISNGHQKKRGRLIKLE